jgi:[ribosomal protein S5]-alanine N-acetyltransferase
MVRLRAVRMRDAAQWSRIRLRDQAHLEPWEPVADVNWQVRHAVTSWPSICSGLRAEARKGRMLPFVIELDGQFCGQLTIGNVTHGALRSAWIGYWVAKDATGGGVATAALALGVDVGFGQVRLHRIEATVRPENVPSRAMLKRAGFREEGLLQRYLEVDGAWRDHLLVAVTVEEMQGSATSALIRSGRASWT